MTIESFLSKLGEIVLYFGGASVVFAGLGNYFGKIWATHLMAKETAKFEKDLQDQKYLIEKKLKEIEALKDMKLHISKAQYDNEYKIYVELWVSLNSCVNKTITLYPAGIYNTPVDPAEHFKYQCEKNDEWVDVYNDFLNCVRKYAPFYKKEFYDQFEILVKKCRDLHTIFNENEIQKKINVSYTLVKDNPITHDEWKEIMRLRNEIGEFRNKLVDIIRDYLFDLKENI